MKTHSPVYRVIQLFSGMLVLASALIISSAQHSIARELAQSAHTLVYEIDYAAVPDLTFRELTLKVDVGTIGSAQVMVDGTLITHEYDQSTGILQFTVDASPVRILLTGVTDPTNIGQVEKATLKDDKKWAWSLGFDDNSGLKPTLSMLESYGYRGTLFQIGHIIDDVRLEDWIIDKPDMLAYLDNGWSFGNHTWDHNCYQTGERTATIIDGYNRISDVVSESNQPNYKVISFAAPCYDADYHPYILSLRDRAVTAVQFNESGGDFPLTVDSGLSSDFTLDSRPIFAFNFDRAIARDARIEYDVPATITEIDWIAQNVSQSNHFWYNSIAHGGNLAEVQQVVDYVYNTYGIGGSDEVWVAPSDQIYSYLLVRELSTVTLVQGLGEKSSETPTVTPKRPSTEKSPSAAIAKAAPPAQPTTTPTKIPMQTPTKAPTKTSNRIEKLDRPSIEISNRVGVAGYEIGIFGSGFGSSQNSGSVKILNAPSQILEWTDTFILAVVPNVTDGDGSLTVINDVGVGGSAPFTVYSIDPIFQQLPQQWFENVAYNQPATVTNLDSYFCYRQPDNKELVPQDFIFNYVCGYKGINNTGKATFDTPATIALQVPNGLSGDYYLQYQVESSWYTFHNVPKDYDVEVSKNSTDGKDGDWLSLSSVTENQRTVRIHHLGVPDSGYKWVRLNIKAGTGSEGQFDLREVRLYKPQKGPTDRWDSFALYGDSLTASAFEAIGPSGLAAKVKELRGIERDTIFTSYGLSGANSTGLIDSTSDVDIYDAFGTDEMLQRATYWGIALGTNDSGDGEAAIGVQGTNVEEFGNRLDALVQDLISRNRVPIIARIPDTIESLGGFGDLAAKMKILNDIDTIVAHYRLIPGPDLYTHFRRNIESDYASYYSSDGTHHTAAGQQKLLDLWAEAFYEGTSRVEGSRVVDPTSPTDDVDIPRIAFDQMGDPSGTCGENECMTSMDARLENVAYLWILRAWGTAGLRQ